MKRFVGIVKGCALIDLALFVAWIVLLYVNPVAASHIALVTLAGGAAILAGALLTSPIVSTRSTAFIADLINSKKKVVN
jgi:hypothetical protein